MGQLSNILLVDESRTAAGSLEQLLSQQATQPVQLFHETSLPAALDCLEGIDLLMLDYRLLEPDTGEPIRQIKRQAPALPVILLGDCEEDELAVRAARAGAGDYLVKWPDDPHLLQRVIRYNLERVQLQQAADWNGERFKLLAQVMKGEIWDWNLDTGELWRTEHDTPDTGQTPDFARTTYDFWLERVHPKDRARVAIRLNTVLGGNGSTWNDEFRYRQPEGPYRHVRNHGRIIRDEEGKALRMIGVVADISERRYFEEVLRQSQERYRTIVENTVEGIWMLDAEGKTTYVNERMAEILGYRSEEMIGRSYFDFTDPRYRSDAEYRFKQRQEGMKDQYDLSLRRRDGSNVWTIVAANALFGEEGRFIGSLKLVTDITQRKQAEEAIHAANQRALGAYSQLLERLTALAQTLATAHDLHAVYHALRDFIVASVPCDRIHLSQYDADGEALLPVFACRDGKEVDVDTLSTIPLDSGPQSKAIRRGEIVVTDELVTASQGDHNGNGQVGLSEPRSSIAVPMIVLGRVIGAFEVQSYTPSAYNQENVTAMEMAANLAAMATENVRLLEQERQLRRAAEASEQRFRGLVQNASDLITILDEKGRISYESPSVERILGYQPEEVVGKSIFDFIHPDEQTDAEETLAELVRRPGQIVTSEYRFQHISGSWRIVEATGSNLLQHPSIRGIVANSRDITHRKQRERELEAITKIAAALRTAQQRTDIPPILLDQLQDLLQTDTTALVMDEATNGDVIVELGTGHWASATGVRLPRGKNVSEKVIASGKPYATNDAMRDTSLYHHGAPTGLNATACVPLISNESAIGALWIARQSKIADHEVRLLAACADIAASAIHRASLYEQTEQRVQRLAALHAIDVAISSTFDLNVTLNIFLDHLTTQLEVDAATILLFNRHLQTLEYATGCGFFSNMVHHAHVRLGANFAGEAALERRMVHVPDFSRVPERMINPDFAQLLMNEQFVSYYAVPLIAKGQIQGVLEVYHRDRLNPMPEWLEFLNTLAAQAAIAIDNATLYNDLQRSNTDLSLAYDATIEGWSRALDLRDHETEGHSVRVTEMTLELARRLTMSEQELAYVRWGSLLHDIGKMGVPDSILLKPGPLDDKEWEIMKRHPSYAYELLSPISFLRPALDIPYCHHEKWNGNGYPRGLQGEQIPLPARIFAIVDVWDALSSDRPYRSAWPQDKVLAYIRNQSGQHFDPKIVKVFLGMMQ